MTGLHRHVFAKALDVPEEWFTVPREEIVTPLQVQATVNELLAQLSGEASGTSHVTGSLTVEDGTTSDPAAELEQELEQDAEPSGQQDDDTEQDDPPQTGEAL